jgi:hypothetical protein
MRFTPSSKSLLLVLMVALAFSCSKDTAPESLLDLNGPAPEFRDLIAAGAEEVPDSDLLYCWYEVFECHRHRLSTYNVSVGMYMSFPCEQPCPDTLERTIYQYAPSKDIWLMDHAKMVSLDDSCWEYAADGDLNALWSDSLGRWVIPSMPWQ